MFSFVLRNILHAPDSLTKLIKYDEHDLRCKQFLQYNKSDNNNMFVYERKLIDPKYTRIPNIVARDGHREEVRRLATVTHSWYFLMILASNKEVTRIFLIGELLI